MGSATFCGICGAAVSQPRFLPLVTAWKSSGLAAGFSLASAWGGLTMPGGPAPVFMPGGPRSEAPPLPPGGCANIASFVQSSCH